MTIMMMMDEKQAERKTKQDKLIIEFLRLFSLLIKKSRI